MIPPKPTRCTGEDRLNAQSGMALAPGQRPLLRRARGRHPITAIFLAWALPGAKRPGLPPRSIGVLWLLVAYHPLRYYFEIHYYGDAVARVAALDWAWIAGGIIRNLDTPLLIGLAATALVRRHTLRPVLKILFHWVLFVCALWAASHPYDSMVTEILLYRAFGI